MSTPNTLPTRNVDAIAIVGPTASGKTAAALALAQALQSQGGAEIVSMDSALIYRGMDIGTAKPSPAELAVVSHHLIDILDPLQSYSAAEFVKDATQCMTDIRARGKTPLLVGGTMLYLKALLEGLNDIPAANPEIRSQIQQQAAQLGWAAMHTLPPGWPQATASASAVPWRCGPLRERPCRHSTKAPKPASPTGVFQSSA